MSDVQMVSYKDHYHHHDHDDLANLINCSTMSTGFQNCISASRDAGDKATASIHTAQVDINGEIRTGTAQTVETVHSAQVDINGQIRDSQIDLGNKINTSHNDLNGHLRYVNDNLTNGQRFLQKEVCDGFSKVIEGQSFIRKEICDVGHLVEKSKGEILLENCKSEGRTREELLKGFHNTQLEALKNANAIERQLAECCCETKQLVTHEIQSVKDILLANKYDCNHDELINNRIQIAVGTAITQSMSKLKV